MPTGLATSRVAPAADMLRTMQSIPAPSNSIVPALKTRRRDSERRSSVLAYLPRTSFELDENLSQNFTVVGNELVTSVPAGVAGAHPPRTETATSTAPLI
jgi:hypothetical protein